jgi:hypothetical protein
MVVYADTENILVRSQTGDVRNHQGVSMLSAATIFLAGAMIAVAIYVGLQHQSLPPLEECLQVVQIKQNDHYMADTLKIPEACWRHWVNSK